MFLCTDPACRDQNLVLCHFCRLLGKFEPTDTRGTAKEMQRAINPSIHLSRFHTSTHTMEVMRLASSVTPSAATTTTAASAAATAAAAQSAAADKAIESIRNKLSPPHITYPSLNQVTNMPDLFRCRTYFDPITQSLAVLTHIGAPAGKVRRRQLFDVSTGSRLSDSIVRASLFSRAYSFIPSLTAPALWGIGTAGLLQRFEVLPATTAIVPSAKFESMSGVEAIAMILDHLPCIVRSSRSIKSFLSPCSELTRL